MKVRQPSVDPAFRSQIIRVGIVWGLLFAALVALNWSVLSDPPYHEYAEGFWTEAAFLAETGADRDQLRDEPQIGEGGVRCYVVSVLTSGLVQWMRRVSFDRLLPTAHLIVFGCASLAIAWTWTWLKSYYGPLRAAVVSLAVFTTPIFTVQTQMLGMEWPLAVAVLAVLTLFGGGKILLAVLVVAGAFFIKPTVAPLEISVAGALGLAMAAGTRDYRSRRWRYRLAFVLMISVGAVQALLLMSLARDAQSVHENVVEGLLACLIIGWLMVPYVLPVLGYIAWRKKLYPMRSSRKAKSLRRKTALGRLLQAARIELQRRPGMALAKIYFFLTVASMLLVLPVGRYFVASGSALALTLASACFESDRRPVRLPRHAMLALGLLLAHNVANAWGRWMPPLPAALNLHERMLALPERSLRYRPDLLSTTTAMRLVGELSPSEPILAGKLATQFLCSPYLGYVRTPPVGYTVLDHFSLGKLRPALELLADRPATLIVVGCATGECLLPPPEPGDEILYDDGMTPPLVVYRRRFPADRDREHYERFYRQLVEANHAPYIPYSVATAWGYGDKPASYLRQRMSRLEVAPELLDWLAGLFDELGEPAVADAARQAAENRRTTSDSE